MTSAIGIATADRNLFDVLRVHLILAKIDGIDDTTIETEPLPDRLSARDWLDTRSRVLLVLDPRLPQTAGGSMDGKAKAANTLLNDTRDSGIATPMLVITQDQHIPRELESDCTPGKLAIALPLDRLNRYRGAVLKPFVAMLMRGGAVTAAIPDTFRVIEIEFRKDRSICWLGYPHGTGAIKWNEIKQLGSLRRAAQIFSDMEFYTRRGWTDHARSHGEALFWTHVMESIGEGLFYHIELAAGGLVGLSFRFVIADPTLYPAPFEASVRMLNDGQSGPLQNGPFVLLSAPVVRCLSAPAAIQTSRHQTSRVPDPVRVLFVRSQVGEHLDGATSEDVLEVKSQATSHATIRKSLTFKKLINIDDELAAMRKLAEELGTDRMVLDAIDLSKTSGDTASDYLCKRLGRNKYDVVHYAGHAWSSGFGMEPSLLILPGVKFGEASGLPIEQFAKYAAGAEARFVYLSACRGSSTHSVQSLVMHGVPHALGFRCDVEDKQAAAFAGTFYRSLFDNHSFSGAFRAACAKARECQETDEESPIWITPILLAQTADWAMRD